jgi:transposase
MTQTQVMWAERVREWRESGRTANEFAQGQAYEASTLRYWASRLNRGAATSAGPTAKPAHAVRMVRVTRTPEMTSGEPMAVVIGGARIEVRAGFDRALLAELVAALGGAR